MLLNLYSYVDDAGEHFALHVVMNADMERITLVQEHLVYRK